MTFFLKLHDNASFVCALKFERGFIFLGKGLIESFLLQP